MVHQAEVVVIGGGVIGGSIAYHLAKQGRRVLMLERGKIGSGASSAAAGMLGAQSEMHRSGALFDLARQSRAMFPKLAEELRELTGIDIGLVQQGLLKVALTPEQAMECQRTIAFQRKAGETAAWLTPSEARELEPNLTGRIEGVMRIPGDGQVSAPELTAAYVRAAVMLGAEVKEHCTVHSLRLERSRVTGVVTDEGTIGCGQAVIAAGVHGSRLLAQAGINADVYPVKGECFSVVTPAPLISSTVFTEGCYLVPKRGGRLIVGASMIERNEELTVSVEGLMGLMAKAAALVPRITAAQWEKAWAGLRPQTRDGLPYLGAAAGCEGLFVAAGHYRNGVLLSPVTGALIVEQMSGKRPSFTGWESFAPDRHHAVRPSEGRIVHVGFDH
ncbi:MULTISPECIES: glycine oxidase ThiO [Paenibacillus]|uniref:glycine oxidase n=1 Tax=Paenibacillus albilobatus TaxID=2716884 RepID=A0A920CBW1_9BACL|nr:MULTISPECIES: glycine oxidase ThiO [Paenibacillus]GIO34016.1 glycine oxidase ThiO [Paenibacillus albilobatus]